MIMSPKSFLSKHPIDKPARTLRGGMVGLGMIFTETYRPFFASCVCRPLFDLDYGICQVELAAVASRTGRRAESLQTQTAQWPSWKSFAGPDALAALLKEPVDFVCVATPDNRHFAAAQAVLRAGKHLLIEKPSVLSLAELDELERLAARHRVLAKVVYHKLLDPDHKKLRTLVADGVLQHVNNGYCSLLEPKSISSGQFAEWISGRNPGAYVAVHYLKLIDFTFGGRLKSITASGQRGIVGAADGNTWDSTQMRVVYQYPDEREAAFDLHTSWVTPDNFPGFVEQEVQFRFDNGVWNSHGRKRGVECTVEGQTPLDRKSTLNNHYSGEFLEPWNQRAQRGYGVEVIERFVREVAQVEFGGSAAVRDARLAAARSLSYNDLSADRQVVAGVQALESILAKHAAGTPDCVVYVNHPAGGLVLFSPGSAIAEVLYAGAV